MGQVWKARDTRLDRTVAIKTSKERFSERFEREARAVAALNHPHICTLHDVGPDYLVMEYIEGKPAKGPVPLEAALRIGIEIASALETAHRTGIVHRDLKPANILLAKSGVKLLDFGLAKIGHRTEPAAQLEETRTLTQKGSVIGTLPYMAPEQLQGKPADARSEIFPFGVVLYELLTGRPAFTGSDAASIIAAILAKEPPPIVTGDLLPAPVARILKRCQAKDPDDRWQTATDLREELEWVAGSCADARSQAQASRWAKAGWWVASAAVLAAGATGWLWFQRAPGPQPVVRFTVPTPVESRLENTLAPHVSPDGQSILYGYFSAQKGEYWIYRLSTAESVPVRLPAGVLSAAWSPDSKEILFQQGRRRARLDPSSGAVVPLGAASDDFSLAPAWSRSGAVTARSYSIAPVIG
jgi:serine/threonine protein kinase